MGWMLYGIGLCAVILLAINESESEQADLEAALPLLFFAQASISVSTRYYRAGPERASEEAKEEVEQEGIASRTRSRRSLVRTDQEQLVGTHQAGEPEEVLDGQVDNIRIGDAGS